MYLYNYEELSKDLSTIGLNRLPIDWGYISQQFKLTKEFIEKYHMFLYHDKLAINKNMTWDLILSTEKYLSKIIIDKTIYEGVIPVPEEYIEKHYDRFDKNKIVGGMRKYSDEFIDKHFKDFENAPTFGSFHHQNVSQWVILKHIDYFKQYPFMVSKFELTEKFIEDYPELIQYRSLQINTVSKLSPEFITKHITELSCIPENTPIDLVFSKANEICLEYYLMNHTFTNEEIDKYSTDKNWSWPKFSSNKHLTREQISKYIDKLDLERTIRNMPYMNKKLFESNISDPEWKIEMCTKKVIDIEFIDKYYSKLKWDGRFCVCAYMNLPEWFIEKHKDKIEWSAIEQNIFIDKKNYERRISSKN